MRAGTYSTGLRYASILYGYIAHHHTVQLYEWVEYVLARIWGTSLLISKLRTNDRGSERADLLSTEKSSLSFPFLLLHRHMRTSRYVCTPTLQVNRNRYPTVAILDKAEKKKRKKIG